MLTKRECDLCGREIIGPSFFRHSDSCCVKHGKSSGKRWREIARRTARKYSTVLTAMAKRPEEHLAEIYGTGQIGPQEVIDALNGAAPRKQLNWVMSCSWAWRERLEKDVELWPVQLRAQIWDTIWETYQSLYAGLRGRAPLLVSPAKNP